MDEQPYQLSDGISQRAASNEDSQCRRSNQCGDDQVGTLQGAPTATSINAKNTLWLRMLLSSESFAGENPGAKSGKCLRTSHQNDYEDRDKRDSLRSCDHFQPRPQQECSRG